MMLKDYIKNYLRDTNSLKKDISTLFEIRNRELYYRGVDKPLMYKKGKLRSVKEIKKRLGEERLRDLGFFRGEVTAQEAVILNKAEEGLPSASDIDKADDMELQEIAENGLRSIENLNQQVQEEPTEDLPMQELLGLDKQLRSIRGSLKIEVAKKVQLKERIKKEYCKLKELRVYPGVYNDEMREDITKRIDKLNDELKVRQESIDLLKGRLKNQITSFKETIAKVLDSNAV